MQKVQSNAGEAVVRHFGPVTVDGVNVQPSLNDKKDWAQVRQTVTLEYPGVRNANSRQDALFPVEAFKAEAQRFNEIRVAWIPVPRGTTKEAVEAALKQCPNPRLIKILDLKPILSEEQIAGIKKGISRDKAGNLLTLDSYREKQAVRHPETKEKILYNGEYEQYRVISFMRDTVEDIDNRLDTYIKIKSETTVHMGAAPETVALENQYQPEAQY